MFKNLENSPAALASGHLSQKKIPAIVGLKVSPRQVY